MNTEKAYLKPSEVARELGISPVTVFRMIRECGLPAFDIGSGSFLVSREELMEWLESRRVSNAPKK